MKGSVLIIVVSNKNINRRIFGLVEACYGLLLPPCRPVLTVLLF